MSGSAGLTAPDIEIYLHLMSCPTYRQDLDLVIVNETNEIVGFANIWLDSDNNIAIIEPFGTAPTYRRRGLATNLLYECMRQLKEAGVSKLYINHGECGRLIQNQMTRCESTQELDFKHWEICLYGVSRFLN